MPLRRKLVADDSGFALDDLHHASGEIANGNPVLYDVIASIKRAVTESCEVENRFAQSLAGNRASVDTNAADHIISVDNGDALSSLEAAIAPFWPAGPLPMTMRS